MSRLDLIMQEDLIKREWQAVWWVSFGPLSNIVTTLRMAVKSGKFCWQVENYDVEPMVGRAAGVELGWGENPIAGSDSQATRVRDNYKEAARDKEHSS